MASTDHTSEIVIEIKDDALGQFMWKPSEHTQEHLRKLYPAEADREDVTRLLADELATHLLRLMADICDANSVIETLTLALKDQHDEQAEQAAIDLLLKELLGEGRNKPQAQPRQPALW